MRYFVAYMIIISFVAFILCGIDKHRARAHGPRIPERTLLFFCAIGGAPLFLLAMKIFHHKTRHRKFTISVPILCVVWIALILWAAFYWA